MNTGLFLYRPLHLTAGSGLLAAFTLSVWFCPLIFVAVGLLAGLPPATAAFFNNTDMEPNPAQPPLADALVAFYTLDFQQRHITAAQVTTQQDGPGHIRDVYQDYRRRRRIQ